MRRRGAGRSSPPPPAKEVASRLGIPVFQPERPELPDPVSTPRSWSCARTGSTSRRALLERPLWLNVHPSLLPRWRGAAPVERAILAGDESTGVTIHRTVAELDGGPIAAQEAFPIGELDAGEVYERCAAVAARLLERVLEDGPRFAPQPEEGVTYAEKIGPADRELDLADPLAPWRRVRALSPHIGAWAMLARRRVTSGARGSRTAASCPTRSSPRAGAG